MMSLMARRRTSHQVPIRRIGPVSLVGAFLARFVLSKESPTICTAAGCLLLPRDVAFDTAARKALQKIRRHHRRNMDGARTERLDDYKAALNELESCSDDQKLTLTMVGYKGGAMNQQINQDRALVMSPFRIQAVDAGQEDGLKPGETLDAQLVGVFDGHGDRGEEVSEYTVRELPKLLAAKLEHLPELSDKFIRLALNETFIEIDQSIPTKGVGGCTASVVLRLGSKLYVANAGDSVSLVAVCAHNQTHVTYVTREDKPDLPDERKRIEAMGGEVYIPQSEEEDSPRVMSVNRWGVESGLAMSRSIGDWESTGVIAEPLVDVLDLRELVQNSENHSDTICKTEEKTCAAPSIDEDIRIVAISATDGLMDYLQPTELADALACGFSDGDGGPHPLTIAEDLILQAAKGWNEEMEGTYRDDIVLAAAAIKLDS